jgi:retinol dehydrogenase 12
MYPILFITKHASERILFYFTSVLNVWFARSLQSQLSNSGSSIIVNSLSPGFCQTNIPSGMPEQWQTDLFKEIQKTHAYTAEEGSRYIIHAALIYSGDVQAEKELRGEYFSSAAPGQSSEFSRSENGKKLQQRIWVCLSLSLFVTR